MQFINIWMLLGLLAVSIPIIIQLLNRKNVRRIPWGAWLFLDKTMKKRKKKVLLEDILLLACRCLALGLLALAFARPFVRPDSPVPWMITLPLMLVGIVGIGISFCLWRYPKARKISLWSGAGLLALALVTIIFERQLNLKRFGSGATKDVVLLIDGSASMSIMTDGKSNFERAIEEVKKYIEQAPRNTSFSIIVGGPVPQVLNPVPLADKRLLLSTLDRVHPVNGTLQIAGNLTAAAVTLATGHNAVKQIVIVGDGQAVGWAFEDTERWKNVRRAFDSLKINPIITWRTLPLPTSIRNLAVASVRPHRTVIGTDREVSIDVTVANTGTEAVTPEGVSLTVEGQTLNAKNLHQLEPGERQVFTFRYQFRKSGGHVLTARVKAKDDLTADDTVNYALPILGTLKVLIVEGNPGAPFINRSSTYVGLALNPQIQKKLHATGLVDKNYLIETQVEDVTVAAQRKSFSGYAAIVLAGVRRFAPETLDKLALFVAAGGGLFFMPSPSTDLTLFREWQYAGKPVLPASFLKWQKNTAQLSSDSFQGLLSRFQSGSDLAQAAPQQILALNDEFPPETTVLARLTDETPFLLSGRCGQGLVIMSTSLFDPLSGLVSLRSFLPMVHELIYNLASPVAISLNQMPSDSLSMTLVSGATAQVASAGNGLIGYYYKNPEWKGTPILRLDPTINFDWGWQSPFPDDKAFPIDNFTIQWKGLLTPPLDGVYTIGWDVDDRADVQINGRALKNWTKIRLKAGVPIPIHIAYFEGTGVCRMRLRWHRPDAQPKAFEIIPSSALTARAVGTSGGGDLVDVKDPHGEMFRAGLCQDDRGLYLHIARSITPGIYEVANIPASLKETLANVMTDKDTVRFTVSVDVEESTLTAVTQMELSKLNVSIQVTQALKEEDVIKAIGGQSFGQEVWRVLAVIAFLFLVAEPALARWIAINRKTGDMLDTEGSWIRM